MKLVAESGKEKGQYKRESVRGGIIAADTAQVNLSIVEYGEKPRRRDNAAQGEAGEARRRRSRDDG